MNRKRFSLLLILLCFSLSGCRYMPVADLMVCTGTSEAMEEAVTADTSSTEESTTEGTVIAADTQAPDQTQQVEFVIDPARAWLPLHDEFINLWASAGGSDQVITRIPVGDALQFEGWQGRYARVTYKGTQGYVSSNYIKPADPDYFSKNLKAVAPTDRYSYQQMLSDMDQLQALYPSLVRIASIGKSELGRKIPVLLVGEADAEYHVLIQGAIHAREHFTAWLAMAMADHTLLHDRLDGNVCYHIIPMSNPDGVILSQSETLDDTQKAIYWSDWDWEYTHADAAVYAEQWKANALGVDLNRNFSSGWEESLERTEPSSEKYRGEEPFCAAESQALRDYTLAYDFDATVSLHSHGSVIYYQYGSRQPVNRLSYSLALAVSRTTGYIPTADDNTTGAGYKDWAMDALGIPSLTLEIGSYTTPLAQRDIYNTFDRCKDLLPTISHWLSQNERRQQ